MARLALKLAIVAAALWATGIAGWLALGFKNWEWHERLTLEVETPTGTISRGSVVAVKAGTTPKWLPGEGAGGMGSKTIGEASFVEVSPGKYLFALLGNELDRTLTIFLPEIEDTKDKAAELETLRETRDVPRKKYPLLVTFLDIAEPRTVQKVDPDNLAASFGPGVILKRITLEITDDGVTKGGIGAVLGWLNDPAVMENPGWSSLPIESRRAIGALLSHFPDSKGLRE
ncbi:hypothetical protein EOA23_24965 [Mesorhizobium sp. M2A.F.Ca.ET.042.01.1.1]|uniref:hypothetical protein n=1 Tax=Mesorhizobium sp. M2A.F.Ca.ET.042.01.1.1 TaxID=2496745 RepID=UPI000FCAAB3C|nr:hypothetical protein [Mesorhizobium sp. M2A.F.Ca.ET.042.01.1.1]RUX21936.1 hypothetical protein EOA23_24965 [Mesorhizobium sp. M2A.F.Ca.ET.042.01.1.1]